MKRYFNGYWYKYRIPPIPGCPSFSVSDVVKKTNVFLQNIFYDTAKCAVTCLRPNPDGDTSFIVIEHCLSSGSPEFFDYIESCNIGRINYDLFFLRKQTKRLNK